MKQIFIGIIILFLPLLLLAQKPAIDTSVFDKWPLLYDAQVSNNGKYFSVKHIDRLSGQANLIVQDISGSWKQTIQNHTSSKFSDDSRLLITTDDQFGLKIYLLGSDSVEHYAGVTSFTLYKGKKVEWLVYTNPGKELTFLDLVSRKTMKFANVTNYTVNKEGNKVALFFNDQQASHLELFDLSKGTGNTIWDRGKIGNLIFDEKGEQLAFITEQPGKGNAICFYEPGMARAEIILDVDTFSKGNTIVPGQLWGFYGAGSVLSFGIQNQVKKSDASAVLVNVWNYKDLTLQSEQLGGKWNNPTELYSIKISVKSIMHITGVEERVLRDPIMGRPMGEHGLIMISRPEVKNGYNKVSGQYPETKFLVNLVSGERKEINISTDGRDKAHISPDGKFVVFFSSEDNAFISYEIQSGVRRNITHGIRISWKDVNLQELLSEIPTYIVGWVEKDKGILIHDRNGVWEIDPANQRKPIKLIQAAFEDDKIIYDPLFGRNVYKIASKFILRGFNKKNQNCGFYEVTDGYNKSRTLSEGPYQYEDDLILWNPLKDIVKARDANVYLVKRQSAKEFPNYYFSTDLISLKQLTFLQPEKPYNWLSTELHKFDLSNNDSALGILYKPENFNAGLKYPVIINYYETLNNVLNKYLVPKAEVSLINFPQFVSNGYLIFNIGIEDVTGKAGESALQAVEGAYELLKNWDFIDSTKIGLLGHSYGGYETNYIVTHSKHFAAAFSGAGAVNLTSLFGALWGGGIGSSKNSQVEQGQYLMGCTPWENPDSYIKNSPIFSVENVVTPLLILHNAEDGAVPFAQGIEFFTALRRLGKKVWMLQYDKEDHILVEKKNKMDLAIRAKQFFDHYLKGAPEPVWMKFGIPARMKGIETGLDFK